MRWNITMITEEQTARDLDWLVATWKHKQDQGKKTQKSAEVSGRIRCSNAIAAWAFLFSM